MKDEQSKRTKLISSLKNSVLSINTNSVDFYLSCKFYEAPRDVYETFIS